MNRCIIFDMDGVLVDSQPMHYEGDRLTLEHFGVEITINELEKYTGTSDMNRYEEFKALYHLEYSVEEMVDYRLNLLMSLVKTYDLPIVKGVHSLLVDLKSQQLKIALDSSSTYAFIEAILERLEIKEFFDIIVSGEDVTNSKPEPDIFIKVGQLLSIEPSECVVIEDSTNGVVAAKRADMKVVGYINATSGQQDLSMADFAISSMNKISSRLLIDL